MDNLTLVHLLLERNTSIASIKRAKILVDYLLHAKWSYNGTFYTFYCDDQVEPVPLAFLQQLDKEEFTKNSVQIEDSFTTIACLLSEQRPWVSFSSIWRTFFDTFADEIIYNLDVEKQPRARRLFKRMADMTWRRENDKIYFSLGEPKPLTWAERNTCYGSDALEKIWIEQKHPDGTTVAASLSHWLRDENFQRWMDRLDWLEEITTSTELKYCKVISFVFQCSSELFEWLVNKSYNGITFTECHADQVDAFSVAPGPKCLPDFVFDQVVNALQLATIDYNQEPITFSDQTEEFILEQVIESFRSASIDCKPAAPKVIQFGPKITKFSEEDCYVELLDYVYNIHKEADLVKLLAKGKVVIKK